MGKSSLVKGVHAAINAEQGTAKAGGASLKAAIERIAWHGTIVVYGNSSGEPTEISFRDFAEHQNARIQGFHYFTSEPEDRFGADLRFHCETSLHSCFRQHLRCKYSFRFSPAGLRKGERTERIIILCRSYGWLNLQPFGRHHEMRWRL
jgi:hypothetical protein